MVKVCMSSNSEFSMVVPSVTGFDLMYNVSSYKIKEFNQYQQNEQSPLTSNDHDIRR